MRTFGNLYFNKKTNGWEIKNAEPHVCIKLKAIFTQIPTGGSQPFFFNNLPETCHELLWFTERYPLSIKKDDLIKLQSSKKVHIDKINELESIMLPSYKPRKVKLKKPYKGRKYQLQFLDIFMKCMRMLNADEVGLGKTFEGILVMLKPETLPCLVTVQTHLPLQWKEKIEQFTDLKIHIIKGTKPYDLPKADVYITKYSLLAGWVNVFEQGIFNSAIFDEIQELRHNDTGKYNSAQTLCRNVDYVLGLTASPIYNYAIEIYNIMDAIKEGCLGNRNDFMREWLQGYGSKKCKDPQALGAYLRENFLMIRRDRKEVGRELPPRNVIVQTVPYDQEEVEKADEIARKLAMKVMHGSFTERGQASRELDMLARQSTGIAKARGVADYVKILLDNNIPVILSGWHRDVYTIWLEQLKEYNPVMYTGSEIPSQKEKSKNAFINGETNLFIISLRSGIGIEGLQKRRPFVVHGELDWSPQIHNQVAGRADREDEDQQMQDTIDTKEGVTEIFLITDAGSDPLIVELLGLKKSQSHGIMNPFDTNIEEKYSDDTRIKLLAKMYLDKINSKANDK